MSQDTEQTTSNRISRRKVELALPSHMHNLFHQHPSSWPTNYLQGSIAECVLTNPNVFVIHDFLKWNELEKLDTLLTERLTAFEQSFTDDDQGQKVLSDERTSSFVFLGKGENGVVRAIEERAATLVGLTPFYVEPLQVVRYTDDQKFNLHHDSGTLSDDGKAVSMVMPRRLVTIFVYLNSTPAGIGCTEFPAIGLSIQPIKGSAVLFCNVLPNGDPDPRLSHSAAPVMTPIVKFGLNIWICDTVQNDDSGSYVKPKAVKRIRFSDLDAEERENATIGVLQNSHSKNMEHMKDNVDSSSTTYWT